MADLTSPERKLLLELSRSKTPSWLMRAFDPSSPLHPDEGAAHTESYELEDGRQVLVPRVRMRDGKPIVLSGDGEAYNEAMKRNDFIVVPKGQSPTAYSKSLSSLIGKMRSSKQSLSIKPRPKKLLNVKEK
jgi:hypothetical protein|tara:strand:- start:2354 stop:2746 length:393 start_codon:yes stop_codon:yes gene_type:complete